MVRMGELAASRTAGDVLVAIGLGSCIGLALLDRARGAVGLAHVVLPASTSTDGGPTRFKFADHAVPALYERVIGLGARKSELQAVLVGGAQMFALTGSLNEIGSRNEQATLAELATLGVPVVAKVTAGSTGRTMRVHVEGPRVLCKEAGGKEVELL
jgi:chemotaxis protein CheD